MSKEWSTLTFSKLWTFPWKIFTHLSLGAKGLTSQIRTATGGTEAEGDRDRQPWHSPRAQDRLPDPPFPRGHGDPAASPAGGFALAEQQQCGNTKTAQAAIPKWSPSSSHGALPHPATSHGHSPDGLSLTEGHGDRQGGSWAVTSAEGTQPSHLDTSQSAQITCAMALVLNVLQQLGCQSC